MKRLLYTLLLFLFCTGASASERSSAHQEYTETLWTYVNGYSNWTKRETPTSFDWGPPLISKTRTYVNRAVGESSFRVGSALVNEHVNDEGKTSSFTVYVKNSHGFDSRHDDWYWAHFLPGGEVVKTSADKTVGAKPGFACQWEDGRLWVFEIHDPALADFVAKGEPAQCVIRVGAGPGGATVKSSNADTILRYLAHRKGFKAVPKENRLWIFEENSASYTDFLQGNEPAKSVTWPGAGPSGVTLRAVESATLQKYVVAKERFFTKIDDGRLWVFKSGSEELQEFQSNGELGKHVIRPSTGPRGITIKAPDSETIDAYLNAQ